MLKYSVWRFLKHRFPYCYLIKVRNLYTYISLFSDENSLKPNEVENLKALSVMNVDLNVAKNALSHKTKRYNCTKKQNGHQCVLRRGQEFCINITFNRPYYKKHDDLFFVLRAGNIIHLNTYQCHVLVSI